MLGLRAMGASFRRSSGTKECDNWNPGCCSPAKGSSWVSCRALQAHQDMRTLQKLRRETSTHSGVLTGQGSRVQRDSRNLRAAAGHWRCPRVCHWASSACRHGRFGGQLLVSCQCLATPAAVAASKPLQDGKTGSTGSGGLLGADCHTSESAEWHGSSAQPGSRRCQM